MSVLFHNVLENQCLVKKIPSTKLIVYSFRYFKGKIFVYIYLRRKIVMIQFLSPERDISISKKLKISLNGKFAFAY